MEGEKMSKAVVCYNLFINKLLKKPLFNKKRKWCKAIHNSKFPALSLKLFFVFRHIYALKLAGKMTTLLDENAQNSFFHLLRYYYCWVTDHFQIYFQHHNI